ncbi:MAG: adenylosuccinate lyase [Anaerolineae bacterium CG_4_9_14_3_um_filter_57_17]|nr:adenylosuccinate lyase [bacterium]NCT21204.1 adenylosuccinate lyase [bacterium]OIO84261.1 MAG: adenylosuccinate lyase [Anaerolineae bacterium CG2_30_57_67]PJB68609.1 MAG: adenylosuccinate lyase [Anaerolineae bacterium CG_4_9_14_3_um_filter_57_17]
MMTNFDAYQSPFSFRYASPEMRALWSESEKRKTWRRIWLALAQAQQKFGLVTSAQAEDLRAHVAEINLPRALEIEAEIHHDLMAEVRTYAEQAPLGGGIIHLGATSMDIEDNADALRLRAALDLTLRRLAALLAEFAAKIERYAATPLIAFTHLQPAEPSTLGYRLAMYAQDLLEEFRNLQRLRSQIRGKGFKGAVGTSASYVELLGDENAAALEAALSQALDLPFYRIATQTTPRKQEYDLLAALAGLTIPLYKFAFDLRLLQSPPIGELAEPFGEKQVGSSAMPFKRNPIRAEKINSLGRALAGLPRIAWDNAAHSLLERTLDDSANRRALLPEAFLALDEILLTASGILRGLRVDEAALARNLDIYGPFAATERVLMAAVKAGASRQEMHEILRLQALTAWEALRAGNANPLAENLARDPQILRWLAPEETRALIDYRQHVGSAPARARALAAEIRQSLA